MSIALALKGFFSAPISQEWLMGQYALSGERKYLEQLYDASCNDLYHFLLTLSDEDLAKDICQKTWLRVIEQKHKYRSDGRFQAWLFTIARNLLMDEFRKSNRLQSLDTEVVNEANTECNKIESIDAQDMLQALDQALNKLPWSQREAFVLHQEGFGIAEISEITSVPYEAIKSRIRYAKQTLRALLENHREQK